MSCCIGHKDSFGGGSSGSRSKRDGSDSGPHGVEGLIDGDKKRCYTIDKLSLYVEVAIAQDKENQPYLQLMRLQGHAVKNIKQCAKELDMTCAMGKKPNQMLIKMGKGDLRVQLAAKWVDKVAYGQGVGYIERRAHEDANTKKLDISKCSKCKDDDLINSVLEEGGDELLKFIMEFLTHGCKGGDGIFTLSVSLLCIRDITLPCSKLEGGQLVNLCKTKNGSLTVYGSPHENPEYKQDYEDFLEDERDSYKGLYPGLQDKDIVFDRLTSVLSVAYPIGGDVGTAAWGWSNPPRSAGEATIHMEAICSLIDSWNLLGLPSGKKLTKCIGAMLTPPQGQRLEWSRGTRDEQSEHRDQVLLEMLSRFLKCQKS